MTAAWTLPQLERVTRAQVLQRALRETGMGLVGTATGGSTTTIVDTTRLQSSQYNSKEHVGGWGRISVDAGGAGAAPEGQFRAITTYAPSTGTLTLDPAFTAAAASGDTYQVIRNPHPQEWLDTLDEIVKQDCYLPAQGILTEVPDGDMEQNNTTDWTASASATVTKDTVEPVLSGVRNLKVVTAATSQYAESNVIFVEPGKAYHLSALVRASAAGTTAQVIAYDKTNSAAIATKTSVRQQAHRVWMQFTVPATCYRMAIRLGASESGVTAYFDDVCLYALDAREIRLPWWCRNVRHVKGIYELNPDSLASDVWVHSWRGNRVPRWEVLPDMFGGGQMRAVAKQGSGPSYPLYVKGLRNETAWSSETEVKHVDADWVNAALCLRIYQQLSANGNLGFLNAGRVDQKVAEWTEVYEQKKKASWRWLEEEETSAATFGWFYGDTGSNTPDWVRRVR